MRLTDLDPRWLLRNGLRVGIVFRCPLEPDNARRLQTCFFVALPNDDQWDACEPIIAEGNRSIIQFCDHQIAWSCKPSIDEATFDNITITPSIDGSKAGNWHGFITNGEIVGGIP